MKPAKPLPQTLTKPRLGRPRLHKVRRQIKLTPAVDEYLRLLGEGQLSAGIERAAELSRATNAASGEDTLLQALEARGILQQRGTQGFGGVRLPPVKVAGQPVSEMIIIDRR